MTTKARHTYDRNVRELLATLRSPELLARELYESGERKTPEVTEYHRVACDCSRRGFGLLPDDSGRRYLLVSLRDGPRRRTGQTWRIGSIREARERILSNRRPKLDGLTVVPHG